MKNAEIILSNMEFLIHDGVIKETNTINTWKGWQKLGFRVKRGEEHIAAFQIWMPKTKKQVEEEETEETKADDKKKKGRGFYLKTAYWFTDEQVVTNEEWEKLYGKK